MPKISNRTRNQSRLRSSEETLERQKKCEQALRKRAEPTFWNKWAEPMACGFIGFLFVSMIYYSWTGDRRKPKDVQVNDETRIEFVNNQKFGFQLGHVEFFEGRNLQDVMDMTNNLFAQDKKVAKCVYSDLEQEAGRAEQFNFYQRFPNCRSANTVSSGVSLGYAEAVSFVIEERDCARSNGNSRFAPSAAHLSACDRGNMGDKGGSMKETLEFLKKEGGVDSECYAKEVSGSECPPLKDLEALCPRKKIENLCMVNSIETIKQEIATHGPVLAVIPAYMNLLTYKSGILKLEEHSRKVTGHLAVKIVGWEVRGEGEEVWVVDMMFGPDHGENGLAYIGMVHNEEFGDYGLGVRLLPEEDEGSEDKQSDQKEEQAQE